MTGEKYYIMGKVVINKANLKTTYKIKAPQNKKNVSKLNKAGKTDKLFSFLGVLV